MVVSRFQMFAKWAREQGVAEAIAQFSEAGFDSTELEQFEIQFDEEQRKIASGFPKGAQLPGLDTWYPGPLETDVNWPRLKRYFTDIDMWNEERIASVDQASSKVLSLTPLPEPPVWSGKGLVVGYVQSGKTTNFTSVIAKATDVGYRLIIVLSGIHNGLRRQTQDRLQTQLGYNNSAWSTLTTLDDDFRRPTMTLASLLQPGSTNIGLAVVKKNRAPLQRLNNWLQDAAANGALAGIPTLIIDDEADQAGVQTAKINPLILGLLQKLPRSTYIGYTATPFANVLIDPAAENLYPSDFILNLPRPDSYFGPERIFGRDAVEGDELDGLPLDGYDMIRIVSPQEIQGLRPPNRQVAATFQPSVTPSLVDALHWFWMATAARRARADLGHSTMLVHTTLRSSVHERFRVPLAELRDEAARMIDRNDTGLRASLLAQWTRERLAVPESAFPDIPLVTFDDIWTHLPGVVEATKIVVDNCYSQDRLSYDTPSQVAIAVGGNTLSRGLTLEGLVVSLFVRSASAYDTLLQMGRWFGFRPLYEDLPRIWMTAELRDQFRHLATVEHEIRDDIAYLERQGLTPMQFGVRIREHPQLSVTAKMGAARQATASYGGKRVQTRYFHVGDSTWLDENFRAAEDLVAGIRSDGHKFEPVLGAAAKAGAPKLFRDVPAHRILGFLHRYLVHPESTELSERLVTSYIEKMLAHGELTLWNVAIMAEPSRTDTSMPLMLAGLSFDRIVRAQLADSSIEGAADIKTLMSKEHRVVDLPGYNATLSRKRAEGQLRDDRNDADWGKHGPRGLLLLYPIDPVSEPTSTERKRLNASGEVIGLALVFPDSTSGDHSYVSVDLSGVVPDLSEEEEAEIEDERKDELSILDETI